MSHKHVYGKKDYFLLVSLLIEIVIKGLKGHIKQESLKEIHSKILSLMCTKLILSDYRFALVINPDFYRHLFVIILFNKLLLFISYFFVPKMFYTLDFTHKWH